MMGAVEPVTAVSGEVQTAWEVEKVARDGLWSQAVSVLTQAARLRRTFAGGQVEPDDFAAFLAGVLAAVAANLGDADLVTAGRPGSWEADLVDQLVRGTVGWDPAHLLAYRTEPVMVPLNVALLVEDTAGVVSFFDAEEALLFAPDVDEATREADWDALHARYLSAYEAYAHRFTQAVVAHALTIPGLSVAPAVDGAGPGLVVPVRVVAETSPDSPWTDVENPVAWAWAGDPLVWQLWQNAVARVGLPVVPDEDPEAA